MKGDRQTPVGRRWVCLAMRLGLLAVLVAALEVNSVTIRSTLLALLIIAAAFVLVYSSTSRRWLKRVIVPLAILFFLPVGTTLLLFRASVSASAPSPDGRVVAEVHEVHTMPDYNFEVCLVTKGRWGTSHSKCVFRSPDEGPPNTQRLLWSRDGRYLLLLTTRKDFILAREEARLASGEYLYLLVDTAKDVVYTNAPAVRDPRPFSLDDLSKIDFGESLTQSIAPGSPAAQ